MKSYLKIFVVVIMTTIILSQSNKTYCQSTEDNGTVVIGVGLSGYVCWDTLYNAIGLLKRDGIDFAVADSAIILILANNYQDAQKQAEWIENVGGTFLRIETVKKERLPLGNMAEYATLFQWKKEN